jgi:hypothetical protein
MPDTRPPKPSIYNDLGYEEDIPSSERPHPTSSDVVSDFTDTINSTFKQRSKCLCLPKKELLEVDIKKRCDYKCLYCY